MDETTREQAVRPGGVTVLGWVHVAAGGLCAVSVAPVVLLRSIVEVTGEGIPVELLVLIAIPLVVGVWLGLGLLKGRSAAWIVATSGYFLIALASLIGIAYAVARPGGLRQSGLLGAVALLTAILGTIAGLLVYLYLLGSPARGFFGLGESSRWKPVAAHLAVGLAIVAGLTLTVRNFELGDRIARLHSSGSAMKGTDAEVEFMLDRLARGNPEERVSAAWALGRSGRSDLFPDLLRVANEDPDTDVRANAIASLAELGGDGLEELLLGFLAEDEETIQAAALRGLAAGDYRGGIEQLGVVLAGGADSLRPAAADLVGRIGGDEALPVLIGAASDPLEEVRSRVAYALGKQGDSAAVPVLVEMLSDTRWEVRANSIQALGMIGDASARPAVERMTNDPESQVRWIAEATLEKLR